MIDLAQDFHDMLIELADAGADFVVVGGYAVAFHGFVRTTKDIDVLVRPTKENAQKVIRALTAFGAPLESLNVRQADIAVPGCVVQIGLTPTRIDIINQATGITFDEAIGEEDKFELEGRSIPVVGIVALVKNKRAAGRDQDLIDVKKLTDAKG